MNNIISDIKPNIYTLSAIAIGFALINKNTPAMQNSLGNYFMIIGQVLATNATQQKVINTMQKEIDKFKTSSNI